MLMSRIAVNFDDSHYFGIMSWDVRPCYQYNLGATLYFKVSRMTHPYLLRS